MPNTSSLKDKVKAQDDFGVWSIEKRVKLTRQISFLSIGICLFYIAFDFIYGAYSYLPYYSILFFGSISSLILLRFKRHTLAKISLMVSGIILLGILASWETSETAVFMYFLVVAVASLTLFGAEEKLSAILIACISIGAFYIVYFTDWLVFEKLDLTEDYIASSFLINFCVCLIALMTMVFHILSISKKYEQKMYRSQEELITLTHDLTESRNRFELAIRGSSAGIWDWDIIKDDLFISPLLLKTLNYSIEKQLNLNSKRLFSILHPDDHEEFRNTLQNHFSKIEPFRIECRLKKGDESFIWVLVTGQAEWDDEGRPIRMVGTVLDIDDQRRAFKQVKEQNILLAKTNEELDRFVYSTSHDLRAPLSSILGLIKVTELSDDATEKAKCLVMMEKRVHTLNGFIADIIDYSRNSRLGLDTQKIKLKSMMDEVIDGLKYFERSQSIDFHVSIPDDFIVTVDGSRLKVVLNNLIANAIKYHNYYQTHPSVNIKSEVMNDHIIISITDNGIGIAPEYHDKIFNMFYRASDKSEGSGLGLYIAKEMIEKLNGKMRMESKLDEGTSFYLELPIQEVLAEQNA